MYAPVSEAEADIVLLVEDDDDLRGEVARSLRERSFQVIEAADGAAALRHMREQSAAIDWLIADVHLGDISGIHVAFEFRFLNPTRPIIFITGFDMPSSAENVSEAVVLRKPFRVHQLLETMETFRMSKIGSTLGL